VQGLRFWEVGGGVHGVRFKVGGSGFEVWGLGCRFSKTAQISPYGHVEGHGIRVLGVINFSGFGGLNNISSSLIISSLELSDTNVYEPQILFHLGTAAHLCLKNPGKGCCTRI